MKSVSIWIGYLMYALFALSVLSITIFVVKSYLDSEKTKITVKNSIGILMDIKNKIEEAKKCFECGFKYKISLPKDVTLYIKNHSIYILFTSNYYYNYSTNFVNITIKKIGNLYRYNISINVNVIADLNFKKEACLFFNKTRDKLYIQKC